MRDRSKIFLMAMLVLGVLSIGAFSASATELESTQSTEQSTQDASSETQEQSTEITSEDTQASQEDAEHIPDEENETESDTSTEITEQTTELEEEATESEEEAELGEELEALLSEEEDQTGLYYYLQKYQYDCQAVYLEKYISFLDLQIKACEQMYNVGDITEQVLKSYQTQKTLAQAELQIARNESTYNNLYLQKNELDYSDYNVKELKGVESIEYYMENYPEKDYMTLARYVTDYNNAVVEIQAKQQEIATLEADVKLASLLLGEGELSQLELAEKENTLAQAQYELEQCYVEMNIACYKLELVCK